tara:strand:+ start:288 stop:434 length:147 start_codon:yes stop_codon:yes gene_type:complete
MKDNGRPKLGYSNIYWTIIDRKERKKPVDIEEEILDDPIVIPMEQKND